MLDKNDADDGRILTEDMMFWDWRIRISKRVVDFSKMGCL